LRLNTDHDLLKKISIYNSEEHIRVIIDYHASAATAFLPALALPLVADPFAVLDSSFF
jgi:hypothetical protein